MLGLAQAEGPSAGALQAHEVHGLSFQMAYAPSGSFQMGSPPAEADRGSDERQHTVTLSRGFYISTTEVTQALYTAVMSEQPWNGACYHPGTLIEAPLQPASCVTWSQAAAFCNALSVLEGLTPAYAISEEGVRWDQEADGYRLPTEAEWEYAARAGQQHTYAGGDEIDPVAWYQGNSERQGHPVGTRKANAWGLHDMSGSLWEWTWDWYDSYGTTDRADPSGPAAGAVRVFRGGAYSNPAGGARAAIRMAHAPDFSGGHVGFRVVLPESSAAP